MMVPRTILVIASLLIGAGAWAQEDQTAGKIMKIDHAASKITIQHRQGGTVGTAANAKLLTDEYQIGQGLAVTGFKAGDQITYTEARVGGTWTVTKINKQ